MDVRIGPYVSLGVLGRGGMGAVHRARHPTLPREVAVKVLDVGPRFEAAARERFRAEYRSLSRIEHPNVVPVLDAGVADDGRLYYVMPLVAGRSLQDHLREGAFEPLRAARLVAKVARALHDVHERLGIVHRDVKPANVLLDAATGEPLVADFGIAKRTLAISEGDPRTESGEVLGTPEFMAPEQSDGRGEVDARTDVYGLGALLYALVAGEAPFSREGGIVGTLTKVLNVVPPRLDALRPEVPRALADLCARALAKEPRDRPATALELARALERLEPRKPRPLRIAVVLVVAAAALVAAWRGRAIERRAEARFAALALERLSLDERNHRRAGQAVPPAIAATLSGTVAVLLATDEEEALVEGARALIRLGAYDAAEVVLERAEATLADPDEAMDLRHRIAHDRLRPCDPVRERIKRRGRAQGLAILDAEDLYDRDDFRGTIAACDEAARRGRWRSATLAYLRGLARLELKEYTATLVDFDEALALTPGSPRILASRARAWRGLTAAPLAVRDATVALERAPDLASARYQRAAASLSNFDLERAASDLAALIETEPENETYRTQLAVTYFFADRFADAEPHAARAPESPLAVGIHVRCALETGGPAAADRVLAATTREIREHPWVITAAAQVALRAGNRSRARALLGEAAKRIVASPELLDPALGLEVAMVAHGLGDVASARTDARQVAARLSFVSGPLPPYFKRGLALALGDE